MNTEEDTFNKLAYGVCGRDRVADTYQGKYYQCKNPGTSRHLCKENNLNLNMETCNCCKECHDRCGYFDPDCTTYEK